MKFVLMYDGKNLLKCLVKWYSFFISLYWDSQCGPREKIEQVPNFLSSSKISLGSLEIKNIDLFCWSGALKMYIVHVPWVKYQSS